LSVLTKKIPFQTGAAGRLVLSRSKALNALTVEMFNQLRQTLEEWEKDPEIKLIVLESDSDRAFCAGGDVKSLVQKNKDSAQKSSVQKSSVQKSSGKGVSFRENFFLAEYGLDYYLYCYSKPILCWAHGITMGGGVGVLNGCSHRVATEASVFAMPEISIGFFPDVGGGYFLNQLPQGMGLFLGMTGARFYGEEAVAIGMADFLIKNEDRQKVIDHLAQIKWSDNSAENFSLLTESMKGFRLSESQSDLVLALTKAGKQMASLNTFKEANQFILETNLEHPTLNRARHAYRKSSPFVAQVIFEHIKACKGLSLSEVFASEWALAIRFCEEPEFHEGVRAQLIDKDKSPRWRVNSVEEISQEEVNSILSPVEKNLLEPQLREYQKLVHMIVEP